jgi:hypothetical protein
MISCIGVLHCLQAEPKDGLSDFRDRSFNVFAFRTNESKQFAAGALSFNPK